MKLGWEHVYLCVTSAFHSVSADELKKIVTFICSKWKRRYLGGNMYCSKTCKLLPELVRASLKCKLPMMPVATIHLDTFTDTVFNFALTIWMVGGHDGHYVQEQSEKWTRQTTAFFFILRQSISDEHGPREVGGATICCLYMALALHGSLDLVWTGCFNWQWFSEVFLHQHCNQSQNDGNF